MSNPTGKTIRRLSPGADNERAWNALLDACPEASFYQLFQWQQINRDEFGHDTPYLACEDESGELTGVLPLVLLESRLFGRILCSMPFVNYGGPASLDDDSTRALLAEAGQITRDVGADYLELRGRSVFDNSLPRAEHKVSMTLELADDPEIIWSSYKSKHRTNIRRVYKHGVTVEYGHLDQLDTFYDLMCRSWRALGTPIYRKSYFRKILEAFPGQTNIFVARVNGTPAAAAFNGYYGSTVEGMWAAMDPAFRHVQINYVLYWEMIRKACEDGFKSYHLGRSTADSGGEIFKKKWGAEAQQLYWQYDLPQGKSLPSLNPDNPRYALAIRLWRRLPIAVTQAIGPRLAAYIP